MGITEMITGLKQRLLPSEDAVARAEQEVRAASAARESAESLYAENPTDENGERVLAARRAQELASLRLDSARKRAAEEAAEAARAAREAELARKRDRLSEIVKTLETETSAIPRISSTGFRGERFKPIGETGKAVAEVVRAGLALRAARKRAKEVSQNLAALRAEAVQLAAALQLPPIPVGAPHWEEMRVAALHAQWEECEKRGFAPGFEVRPEALSKSPDIDDLGSWMDLSLISRSS